MLSQVVFKSCTPFVKHITKIDERTIYDAEDLALVMLMYNLMKYSSNYSETTESLWFYSKDEATNFNTNVANNNSFEFLEYKAKLFGNTVANGANGLLRNVTMLCHENI